LKKAKIRIKKLIILLINQNNNQNKCLSIEKIETSQHRAVISSFWEKKSLNNYWVHQKSNLKQINCPLRLISWFIQKKDMLSTRKWKKTMNYIVNGAILKCEDQRVIACFTINIKVEYFSLTRLASKIHNFISRSVQNIWPRSKKSRHCVRSD